MSGIIPGARNAGAKQSLFPKSYILVKEDRMGNNFSGAAE